MESSDWQSDGEVEELSGSLETLLDDEEPGDLDSESSSCSDMSISAPIPQPNPNSSKSFSGLRIFGMRWVTWVRKHLHRHHPQLV